MVGLLTDLRGAWRLLCRYRGTSALIVVTLALGFGANLSMFAIANGVLLRPFPYEDPDHLVLIWVGRADAVGPSRGLATPRFLAEIQSRQRSFSSIAAVELWDGNPAAAFDLALPDGAERLHGAFVTPNFFQTLGVNASVGRILAEDDPADVAEIGRAHV